HRGFNVIIAILSTLTLAYIVFPLTTILTFLDPLNIFESLARQGVWNAFILSLFTATISTSILCVIGIPFAYFLARYSDSRGKFILRAIVIIPLVLPPLASGTLLLGMFAPTSISALAFPGAEFTQSVLGIILAQTYIASPFMILASQAAFESVDRSYENVARVLGKNNLQTFFRVSLPLARTGIIIGIIMSWVRAVGELGATMMMTYNPHTISIQIFEDNAIGGLTQAAPGIILVVTLPILVVILFYILEKNKVQGLLKLG
ncbi:MAG TPA: ABC transporter permease, partial [Nitrososphaeraceae archaeon]|nr:ABC transporter permease [Nitrososphaeraceae archaeon]